MKLTAATYVSPNTNQGTFNDVTIIDSCLTHKREEKYLAITFEMSYIKNGIKHVLANETMGFLGMEADEVSSNKTTTFSILNPDYDLAITESQERITVSMFDYLIENEGVMPDDYQMVDYGFPTYEKVMMYFTGGTLDSPEIHITDPLAIGFLLNSLIINGEAVGNQFTTE
jgi:hypothetical protein